MNIRNFVSKVYTLIGDLFIHKPLTIIDLIKHKEWYSSNSYYPEKKSSSALSNFMYQVNQILKYGAPNKYFYMYGMDVKTKDERKEYVNFIHAFNRVIYLNASSNPHNSTCILRNKLYFDIFAKGIGVRTPQIKAYYSQGNMFIWKNVFVKSTFEDLLTLGNDELFCKETEGECGAGIFILKIVEGKKILKNGIEITIRELKSLIGKSDYLFQEVVKQHSKMSEMYSGSLNTVRLVTVRSLKDGKLHLMPSILRIGANGSYVDNTSQGGIAIGFDLESGVLHQYGFQKPQFGLRLESHPNTHMKFSNFTIPFIKEIEEQAFHFHSMLKDIQSIGWDIAIGSDGPIFIEGNDNWEINGPQVGNHGLKKEFEEFFYK